MATFAYSARTQAGQLVQGSRKAANEAELRRVLRTEGYLLVKAKSQRGSAGAGSVRKIKTKDLALFTFHLQNVLDSGVPILAGLQDLESETRDARFRAVVGELIDSLTGGETLAQALRRHPAVFNSLYVNMVDAGEQTGRLPEVLGRLVQLLEWQEEFRRRVRDLTTYPIIIILALVGLVALVIGFVFPRFTDIFDRVAFELPLPTRILMGASSFLTGYWIHLLLGGLGVWGGCYALLRVEKVRLAIDTWVLKVPVLGELVVMLNFGQVARSLSSFLDAGIAVPQALEMIARMVPNRRVARSLKAAQESILGGETLSGAFRATGLFPPMILRMVKMGEQSGRIVTALEKASTIYDREIPVRTKKLLEVMNPVLTGVMGAMLLFVILSVMLPLYKMYQEIGTNY